MRILRICQDVPYPPDDGVRIEPFHTTKELARRGHEITLLAFQKDPRDTSPLRAFCDLHVIPFVGRNSLPNMARGLIESSPVNYVKYRDARMLDECLKLLESRRYDALVVDYSALGWYVFRVREKISIPVITRWHNVDSLIWKRWAESQSNPVKRILGRRQYETVKRFEIRLAKASDVCLSVGARDAELLQEMAPGANVRYVPPGVDLDYYAPSAEGQELESILFMTSNLKWHASWDTVQWLYGEIMPLVWQRVPNAKLYITGKDAPPEMRGWEATGRVVLTGFVPDERAVMAKASVMVVPMRLGGGIKLKILTAFAAGRAVVSTAAGVEGFSGLEHGEQILVRESPNEFADAVVGVIQNRSLRLRLEERGRAFVCRHYSWKAVGAQWEEAVASAIQLALRRSAASANLL
jgi:glycosyltransferase involved in cell wall biosynthesis